MSNKLIDKVFVVNYNPDVIKDIKIDFADTELSLEQYTVSNISNTDLTDNISNTCNLACTDMMIKRWLAHLDLWKIVYENGYERTLIVEDYAVPVENFNNRLAVVLKELPSSWDILFLSKNTTSDTLTVLGKKDKYLKQKNIFIPASVDGLYGYLLSKAGAAKLIKSQQFKQVYFNLDTALIEHPNLNIYAMYNPLIHLDLDIHVDTHQQYHELLNSDLNREVFNYRPLSLPITVFTIIIVTVSLMIGFQGSNSTVRNFLTVATAAYVLELAFGKLNHISNKVKLLIAELLFVFVAVSIGKKLKNTVYTTFK